MVQVVLQVGWVAARPNQGGIGIGYPPKFWSVLWLVQAKMLFALWCSRWGWHRVPVPGSCEFVNYSNYSPLSFWSVTVFWTHPASGLLVAGHGKGHQHHLSLLSSLFGSQLHGSN